MRSDDPDTRFALPAVANGIVLNVKKFKEGNIVGLEGLPGSPRMKVLGFGQDQRTGQDKVIVCWFTDPGELREAALHEDVLELIEG